MQLAGYTPDREFSQYVIPYMNLNPAAKQRHQVRVITMGFFRMLKNMQTHKVMKTKPEYAALNDFLNFLEEIRKGDPESEGVLLVYHEQRHFVPCMLLSALKRYDLLDRFEKCAVGFVNSYTLAEQKCGKTIKYLTLRQLSKLLLNYSEEMERSMFEGNATVRAKISYDILQHLISNPPAGIVDDKQNEGDAKGLDEHNNIKEEAQGGGDAADAIVVCEEKEKDKKVNITSAIMSVDAGVSALDEQQEIIVRQNSFRPLFVNYFRAKIYHRVRAVDFRRALAEHGFDLEKLGQIWEDKKTVCRLYYLFTFVLILS